MPSDHIFLDRYPRRNFVYTNLDPFDDILDWIKGLRAIPMLEDLAELHPSVRLMSGRSRTARLKEISSHTNAAIGFLEAALSLNTINSFLPLYYGLLNLAKATVLFGPYAADLRSQRHHGLSYRPFLEPSDLLTDRVTILNSGAVPLLYKTLTGTPIQPGQIRLDSAYRYIDGVTYEYRALASKRSALSFARIDTEKIGLRFRVIAEINQSNPFLNRSTYKVPAFSKLRRAAGHQLLWRSRLYAAQDEHSARLKARDFVNPYLLIHEPSRILTEFEEDDLATYAQVASSNLNYHPVEEINILLAFFHMSSVVRYDPLFVERLLDSKAMPLLLTLRRHGLYKYLVAFYSHALQARVVTTRV